MRRLWRRVFHRYWWTLGWRWSIGPVDSENRRRQVYGSLCLSEMNLPRLRWELHEERGYRFIVLDWGNGNSDPVWSIGLQW